LTHDQLIKIHDLIDRERPETLIAACNLLLDYYGKSERVKTMQEAYTGLYGAFQGFLDSDRYTEAALLIWGGGDSGIFDSRPRSVQRIWGGLMKYPKVLIPGAESQGKSYTPAAWSVLDWARDPEFTSGKIISVTSGHAASNLMAQIKTFHQSSALRLPGEVMDKGIFLSGASKRSSITMVALPPSEDSKGRLRGFHSVLRPKPHPQFGRKSRLFAIIDEGEDVPAGLWEGLENMLATQGSYKGRHHVTIIAVANPKKRESPYAQRAKYPNGWENFNLDTSDEWDGPKELGGWHVIRLDAAKSENIVEKREVFPGMLTYESYMDRVRRGVTSAEYFTFARGAWPEGISEFHVTPSYFFNDSVGIYRWAGSDVTPIASLDPAFAEGGDNPVLTTGRYGKAVGFTSLDGVYRPFDSPRYALQLEKQLFIRKDNTLLMADEVVNYLKNLQVRPEYFVIDKTGAGLGLHDALLMKFGGIFGVQWSERASERKILKEDTMTAEERYSGVVSEMAFAFATWLQYGYIKIAPMMDSTKLQSQATGRKYYYDGRGLIRVQSKADFKSETGGLSPDEYDSAIMIPHLIRLRQSQNAAMLPGQSPVRPENAIQELRESVTARTTFYDTA
jgi:hypothetical protein